MNKIKYIKLFYKIIPIGCLFLLNACSSKPRTHSEESKSISLCASNTISSINGIDSLGKPKLSVNIGNSHLAISTQNTKAQEWFDQGLSHLHGFWHLEAYRAFREVIKADSSCAMGYWGLAMCQTGFGGSNHDIWKNAIAKANLLTKGISPLEQALISASSVLINSGIEAAQTPFRKLYQTYPNEPEAIALAAIMLRQHENETTQQEVKHLLENALQRFPNHVGLLHYYVHVMELRPEFAQANKAANLMIKLAYNSPHLVHMPGHLYYLAGDYNKAVATFQTAYRQEYNYHQSENIPFSANQNYLHNLHFLALAQAERGDYQAALDAANKFANVTLDVRVPNEGAAQMLLYEGRILPALVHIRFRKWQKAEDKLSFWLNSLDIPLTNPIVRAYLEGMRAYIRGMKSLENLSNTTETQEIAIAQATQYGGELSQLMKQFEQLGVQHQNTPEFKSINETYDIMSMARYELAGWIDNINPQKPFNQLAWKEAINLQNLIKYDEPPRLMYPIEESLARLHKRRGETKLMEVSIKAALKRRPRSKHILAIR